MAKDGGRLIDLHLTGQQTPLRLWTIRFCRLENWGSRRLAGDYWRCYWNDAPGAEVVVGDEVYALGPDAAVVVPPNLGVVTRLHEPGCGHLHIHFHPGLEVVDGEAVVCRLGLGAGERARFRKLVRLLHAGEESGAHFLGHALLYGILARLPARWWAEAPGDTRIRAALEQMRVEFPRAPTNAALAKRAGMHVNAFIRRFTQVMARSPRQYQVEWRVTEAGHLLHHTDLSLEEVAERTGFADRHHLTRAFRARMGQGPAAFRRLAER